MKGLLAIMALLLTMVSIPIGMYIQWSILQMIHADRLLMFLFWANLPVLILVHILSQIIAKLK